ncbi:MAG: imidazole glycerol phosphate synthase subunit HisH [Idiomarina sp.]
MKVVVVDTECANLTSVCFALERLGYVPTVTDKAELIRAADRVILPGVGTARAAMRNIQRKQLVETLQQLTQPVLGICLGMQLLTESSSEGDVDCLGVIPTQTRRLQADDLPLPHMGWNQLQQRTDTPLLKGLDAAAYCYFVHSFAVPVDSYTIASSHYGEEFAAMIQHQNFYGAQFHPERSGSVGATILKNFLESEHVDTRA